MARQEGTVVVASNVGAAFSFADADQAEGVQFLSSGKKVVALLFNDGSDGDAVCAFIPQTKVDGDLSAANRSVTVPQGQYRVWTGSSDYQVASGDDKGKVQFNISGAGAANLKVAFISL